MTTQQARNREIIGFGLIRRTNKINRAIYTSHHYLRRIDPVGKVELHDSLEGIKERVAADMELVAVEKTRVDGFVTHYPVQPDIDNGLNLWQSTRAQLMADLSATAAHRATVMSALSSALSTGDLETCGNQLKSYTPSLSREVSPIEYLDTTQFYINEFQDLLNAMALELQGRCSYSGAYKPALKDFGYQQKQAGERLATIKNRLPLVPYFDDKDW